MDVVFPAGLFDVFKNRPFDVHLIVLIEVRQELARYAECQKIQWGWQEV
jgi:hypothetical protein